MLYGSYDLYMYNIKKPKSCHESLFHCSFKLCRFFSQLPPNTRTFIINVINKDSSFSALVDVLHKGCNINQ